MYRNPFLFFLFAIIIFGCKENKKATISGNLKNITDRFISISLDSDPRTGLKQLDDAILVKIGEDGSFSFSVDSISPIWITIASKNYEFVASVFLMIGGETHISADCENIFSTLLFSGENANLNNFHFKWNQYWSDAYRKLTTEELSYEQLKKSLETLEIESIRMLDEYSKKNTLSNKEKYWIGCEIKYRKFSVLMDRAYSLNCKPGSQDFSIFEDIDFKDNKAAAISKTYNNLIQQYIVYLVNGRGLNYEPSGENREFYELYYNLTKEKLTGYVKDVMLNILVIDLLNRNETCAEDFYKKFLNDCQSAELRKISEVYYTKYIELSKSEFDPNVEFIQTNNQSPVNLLSKFENKVLYLDFWASWCSPCLKSVSQAMELKKHYENTDFEIIFIGHRDQRSSIEAAIKRFDIIGKHLILNQNETETWRKEFKVGGIPAYVLLDKKHNVVEFNAPHPDSPLIYNMIDSLLIE